MTDDFNSIIGLVLSISLIGDIKDVNNNEINYYFIKLKNNEGRWTIYRKVFYEEYHFRSKHAKVSDNTAQYALGKKKWYNHTFSKIPKISKE